MSNSVEQCQSEKGAEKERVYGTTLCLFESGFLHPGVCVSRQSGDLSLSVPTERLIGDGTIQAWVYENVSFELARDVETESFPWTEEGVSALRDWLTRKLEERGWEPYRIPYPPAGAEPGE